MSVLDISNVGSPAKNIQKSQNHYKIKSLLAFVLSSLYHPNQILTHPEPNPEQRIWMTTATLLLSLSISTSIPRPHSTLHVAANPPERALRATNKVLSQVIKKL